MSADATPPEGLPDRLLAWIPAGLILAAAVSKAAGWRDFLEAIRGYDLLPDAAVPAAAGAVLVLEAAGALLLLARRTRPAGGWILAALLGAFAFALLTALGHDRKIACGCGLPIGGESVGAAALARTVLLGAWALFLAWRASADCARRRLGEALGLLRVEGWSIGFGAAFCLLLGLTIFQASRIEFLNRVLHGGLNPGDAALPFAGRALDGKEVRVEFGEGQPARTIVFVSVHCPHCEKLLKDLAPKAAGGRMGEILVVSADVEKDLARYVADGKTGTLPVLRVDRNVFRQYKVLRLPMLLGLSAQGKVLHRAP